MWGLEAKLKSCGRAGSTLCHRAVFLDPQKDKAVEEATTLQALWPASTYGRALAPQNTQCSWSECHLLVNPEASGLLWHPGWQVAPGLQREVASAPATNSPYPVVCALGLLGVCVANIETKGRESTQLLNMSQKRTHVV